MAIDDDTIARLREQFPDADLRLLEACGESVVVKKPTREIYQRFRSKLANERTRDHASEMLVRDCVVYPDRKAFDAMLDRLPGLAEAFSDEVLELVGLTKRVEVKKL